LFLPAIPNSTRVKIQVMSDEIVKLLLIERTKLDAAIQALQGRAAPTTRRGRLPLEKMAGVSELSTPAEKESVPKRKGMSAATRQKMAEGQKRRWEVKRAVVTELVAPIRKTNSVRISEAIAPKEDKDFKSRMSIALNATWAKRRKAAKKKST
jgi:hypothetical protein